MLKVSVLTPKQRTYVLDRDAYTCVLCGLDCRAARDICEKANKRLSRTYTWLSSSRDDRYVVVAEDVGLPVSVVRASLRARRIPADIDHHIPRAETGGTNHPDNLRTLCTECHREKSSDDATRLSKLPKTRRTDKL